MMRSPWLTLAALAAITGAVPNTGLYDVAAPRRRAQSHARVAPAVRSEIDAWNAAVDAKKAAKRAAKAWA